MSLEGTEILGYRIVECIGEGGMATVWRAEHAALGKTVAIKVLHSSLARDAGIVERFMTEARIESGLDHPNIVRVENVTHDPPAIVMEYVPGQTLEHLIGRVVGPIPLHRALPLVRQICAALSAAHAAGVVHRDVKPSNVLVTDDGRVRVMDFGIAKVAGASRRTRTGLPMGTAAYMSPEQVKGAKDVDARSDVYSLGVTVYELLAGRTPFEDDPDTGSDFLLMNAHVHSEPPDPRTFYPAIPAAAVRVVQRALAKEPADRYESVAAFRAALEAAAAGKVEETARYGGAAPRAGVETVAERRVRPADRRVLAVVAGVLLLAAIGGIGFVLSRDGATGGVRETPAQGSAAVPAPSGGATVAPGPPPSPPAAGGDRLEPPASPGPEAEQRVDQDREQRLLDATRREAEQAERERMARAEAARAEAARREAAAQAQRAAAGDAAGARGENPAGIEWVPIPGGTFQVGLAEGDPNETPLRSVRVETFEIARTEVTVAQYRACVAAGRCTAPHGADGTCSIWTGSKWKHAPLPAGTTGDQQPVVCVTWAQARDFSRWAGGRLPSEAEWEYAARSGGRRQRYPWGDQEATCRLAVIEDGGGFACGRERPWPVCSKPSGNSAQGVCDLAGNVWEWVEDCWTTDCGGSYGVDRGGGWSSGASRVQAAVRDKTRQEARGADLGFRPVRSVP